MKFLNRVTLTGIDQYSSGMSVYQLSHYRFAEFAILLSQSKMGRENRYPPIDFIQSIDALTAQGSMLHGVQLAGHLCGAWVRDLIDGGNDYYNFATEYGILHTFKRIQLNVSHLFAKMSNAKLDTMMKALNHEKWRHVRFIVQVRSYDLPKSFRESVDADYLFDCSGGRGVLPDSWPQAVENCGYAGGLSPDNLKEQLELIGAVAGDIPVWVDVETGIRSNDVFDADKAERFLAIAKEYVRT